MILKRESTLKTFLLLLEAEAIINSRPLTALSDDIDDMSAIMPFSIRTCATDESNPVGDPNDRDGLRRDWRSSVATAQNFWKRWLKYYIPSLQHRTNDLKVNK